MSIDLIVGGTSKAGTTALYDMLKKNPAFFLPERKELHFFSRADLEHMTSGPGDAAVVDQIPVTLDDYLSNYADRRPDQIAVDVSPSYLFHHDSADRIARALPSARALFILRKPEDKVFSQYVHLVGEGRETLSFEEALACEEERADAGYSDMWLYARSGNYAAGVEAFQKALGKDRVMVILFDEFEAQPDEVLRGICQFAGLDGSQIFETDHKSNVSGTPRSVLLAKLMSPNRFTNALRRIVPARLGQKARRVLRSINTGAKPKIEPETKQRLSVLYSADIVRLEQLIGRKTGWNKLY